MLLALRSTDFVFRQSSGMLFLGDVLLEIDGVKVNGKPVREIAHQLLGPPGSPVEIALQVRLPMLLGAHHPTRHGHIADVLFNLALVSLRFR